MNWNWEAVAAIAALGGLFAVFVSLVVSVWQTSLLRRSIQSSTYQNVLLSANAHWELVARHPGLFDVLYHGKSPATLSEADRTSAEIAVIYLFNWHESALLQSEHYKLVSKATAGQWRAALRSDLGIPIVRDFWEQYGKNYHPALQVLVAEELRGLPQDQSVPVPA